MDEERIWDWNDLLQGDTSSSSTEAGVAHAEAALLAEDEEKFLDFIHETDETRSRQELAGWIGSILGETLDPNQLEEDLRSGVRLLHLAKSIQVIKSSHMKDDEYNSVAKNLHPDDINFSDLQPHRHASLVARQRSNIAKFLNWCSYIGVPRIMLFESEDIVAEKNTRQVTTCLLYVAKIASKYGIEPPDSVKKEIQKEEARLLGKKTDGDFLRKRRKLSSDDKNLILPKPPIFETEEYDGYIGDSITSFKGHSELTSTPSPAAMSMNLKRMDGDIDPILPTDLDFLEMDAEVVVIDTIGEHETRKMHFKPRPYIEDIEITETKDMVIIDQMDMTYENDEVAEHTAKSSGSEKPHALRASTLSPDVNGNVDQSRTTSSFENLSNNDGEFHTAHDLLSIEDVTNLHYHTAFVDDVTDDEDEVEAYEIHEEHTVQESSKILSSSETPIRKYGDRTAPFELPPIPADIFDDDYNIGSSDESMTDVESYVSSEEPEVTYTDVGVGTDDIEPNPKEIMINFPPYFEISSPPNFKPTPPPMYRVYPVANEPVYAVPKKSQKREHTYNNSAYEVENEQGRENTHHGRHDSNNRSRHLSSVSGTIDGIIVEQSVHESHVEASTQTHVSLTDDKVRIINEKGDISKIRATSSGKRIDPVSSSSGEMGTLIISAGIQQTLPAYDRSVASIQARDLEGGRPPRWGSVNASSRIKNRDVEAAGGKEVRRSMLRRASSAISEQFEKAVLVAKKYKKELTIISIFLVLAVAALITMLIIFPRT